MDNAARDPSLSQDIGRYLRHQLRGRRGLIAAGALLATPALWLGWPWLVAAGVAPLLLLLAPCAVMCALGLCMKKGHGTSGAGAEVSAQETKPSAHLLGAGVESGSSQSRGSGCADCDSPAETTAPPRSAATFTTQTKETKS